MSSLFMNSIDKSIYLRLPAIMKNYHLNTECSICNKPLAKGLFVFKAEQG